MTTVQISRKLQQTLKMRKFSDSETYEDVIWDMIEDSMELSEEAKRNITKSEKQIREGKTVPFEEIKKKMGL